MTVSIQIDDRIASALKEQAEALGLTLDQYLQRIASERVAVPGRNENVQAADDFDAALDQLFASDMRPLPSSSLTYRRDEIYPDHD
jgi:hypothetical protein